MPEAQERMLEEADELIGAVPLPDRQQLLTLLETLKDHTPEEVQCKITRILGNSSSSDIKNPLELSIQNNNLCADVLQMDSWAFLKSVS